MTTTLVDRLTGVSEGLAVKVACRVATTASIGLFGLQTIDGVVLAAGDRVLVKDQTDATQNGIYSAAVGAWARALDFDGPRDVVEGTRVLVIEGDTQSDIEYAVANVGDIVFGTTAISFRPNAGPDANQALAFAASVVWDLHDGLSAHLTLTGNCTIAAPLNLRRGYCFLETIQGGSGGYHVTDWDPVFDFGDVRPGIVNGAVGSSMRWLFYCTGTVMKYAGAVPLVVQCEDHASNAGTGLFYLQPVGGGKITNLFAGLIIEVVAPIPGAVKLQIFGETTALQYDIRNPAGNVLLTNDTSSGASDIKQTAKYRFGWVPPTPPAVYGYWQLQTPPMSWAEARGPYTGDDYVINDDGSSVLLRLSGTAGVFNTDVGAWELFHGSNTFNVFNGSISINGTKNQSLAQNIYYYIYKVMRAGQSGRGFNGIDLDFIPISASAYKYQQSNGPEGPWTLNAAGERGSLIGGVYTQGSSIFNYFDRPTALAAGKAPGNMTNTTPFSRYPKQSLSVITPVGNEIAFSGLISTSGVEANSQSRTIVTANEWTPDIRHTLKGWVTCDTPGEEVTVETYIQTLGGTPGPAQQLMDRAKYDIAYAGQRLYFNLSSQWSLGDGAFQFLQLVTTSGGAVSGAFRPEVKTIL